MDLLATLTAARARVATAPSDAAAWAALADVLDVVDRGALDPDAAFQLAVDRWEALQKLIELAPTPAHYRAHGTHLRALSKRARDRGHAELSVAIAREQAVAGRVWLRLDRTTEEAAELLAEAAEIVADDAVARGDRPAAQGAFHAMLEALYSLAHRTGKPQYALRIAGVQLHLACQLEEPEEARKHLLVARDLLDKLDAAGLSHPVQTQVRAEVEERLAKLAGD